MVDSVLVSQDNLLILLQSLKGEFLTQLTHVTVFTNASTKISILDLIKTDLTGNNILADDGTYKDPRLTDQATITAKATTVWNLLNIKNPTGYYYPDIPEYNNYITAVKAKTDIIVKTGTGTKLLNDMGLYVDVNTYRGLTTDEVTSLCVQIKGGIL